MLNFISHTIWLVFLFITDIPFISDDLRVELQEKDSSEKVDSTPAEIDVTWTKEVQHPGSVKATYLNNKGEKSICIVKFNGDRQLISYDSDLNISNQIKVERKYVLFKCLPLDIWADGENTIVIDQHISRVFNQASGQDAYRANKIFLEEVSPSGKFSKFIEIEVDGKFSYFTSKTKKYFGVHASGFLRIYNKSLDLVLEKEVGNFVSGFNIDDEGNVYCTKLEENQLYLLRINTRKINKTQLNIPTDLQLSNFVININKQRGVLALSSIIIDDSLKEETEDESPAVGSFIIFLDSKSLEEKSIRKVQFSDELINEAKDVELNDGKGLLYFVNRGLIFNNDKVVHQMERVYKIVLQETSNGSVMSEKTSFNYGNIILMALGEDDFKFKILKKETKLDSYWTFFGSYSIYWKDNDMVLMYNDAGSDQNKEVNLIIKKLNSDLELLGEASIPVYENEKKYTWTNGFEYSGIEMNRSNMQFMCSGWKKKFKLFSLNFD